jgi:hypothetical protein
MARLLPNTAAWRWNKTRKTLSLYNLKFVKKYWVLINPLKPKKKREREERKSGVGSERHYIYQGEGGEES